MLELAEMVKSMMLSQSAIIFKPLPADDPKQRKPDISLTQQKLRWMPRISLKEGLAKMIQYFSNLEGL